MSFTANTSMFRNESFPANYFPSREPTFPAYKNHHQPTPIWEKIESEHIKKSIGHTMTTIDDYIIIFGGTFPLPGSLKSPTTTTTVIFDPRTNHWIHAEPIGQLFTPRLSHSTCLYHGELVVFGGLNYDKRAPSKEGKIRTYSEEDSIVLGDALVMKLDKDNCK